MSLYKTQRCRHFDEAGNPIKPYCSQGNKCRFIHPNDHQWGKLKRRNDESPSPEHRDAVRSKGKNNVQSSPRSPPHRQQRSSPLMSQPDLFKRKQKDMPREYDPREWSVRNGDRRRDSDSYARERNAPFEQGYSLKRPNDESDPYPNQRPRLSERIVRGAGSEGGSNNARYATQTEKVPYPAPHASQRDPKATTKVSDTFHRLAKLCCEIVQDTCFLDREEDKLKAFTGLSSELSRAVPDAAMAVTPALATVITGHTRTRERLESHVEELESLWKTLFSILEADISKAIDSRLERAMAHLEREKENVLRAITRTQKPAGDKAHDGTASSRQRTDVSKETGTDWTASLSERTTTLNGAPAVKVSSEEARYRVGSTSLSLMPTQEGDLGASLRVALEEMRMQMDRQTRAIELLAKENVQLKTTTERVTPQMIPPDSGSSSPIKPSVL